MEITGKIFWREAVRSGTMLGLVLCGITILQFAAGQGEINIWTRILNITYVVVFISLQFAFTKRIAMKSDPATGFSWGRCMGFVFAMLLFVGILLGFCHTILYNLVYPDLIETRVFEMIGSLEGTRLYSGMDLDGMGDMMMRYMKNPFIVTFSSIIVVGLQGGFAGIFTSMLAKRNPQIFAE